MTLDLHRAGRGVAAALLFFVTTPVFAHAIAGARLFPATLAIDDPGVTDELSLPTFARTIGPDGTSEHDFSFELDKRITERLNVSVSDTYSVFGNGPRGFQNLEVGTKYLGIVNADHELIVSVGFEAEVGGTGSRTFADRFSTVGPQFYIGKGFGDLPTSLDPLRPFAVTSQIGFGFPTRTFNTTLTPDPDGGPPSLEIDRNPAVLNWGFSLQYSLLYLNQNVRAFDAPELVKRLIPTVEVALQTPIANIPQGGHTTTGTVNPGVFYEADKYQIGLEAALPINETTGKHPGVIAQLHFFLDDIFPNSIGRPIIQ